MSTGSSLNSFVCINHLTHSLPGNNVLARNLISQKLILKHHIIMVSRINQPNPQRFISRSLGHISQKVVIVFARILPSHHLRSYHPSLDVAMRNATLSSCNNDLARCVHYNESNEQQQQPFSRAIGNNCMAAICYRVFSPTANNERDSRRKIVTDLREHNDETHEIKYTMCIEPVLCGLHNTDLQHEQR